MDVHLFHPLLDRGERVTQIRSQLSRLDDCNVRFIEESALEGVDIARPDQTHPIVAHTLEAGHRRGELRPAASGDHRDRSPVQKSTGGSLWRIEVGVRVEPGDARTGAKSGKRSESGIAV